MPDGLIYHCILFRLISEASLLIGILYIMTELILESPQFLDAST